MPIIMSPTDATEILKPDLSVDVGATDARGGATSSVGGASTASETAPASACGGVVEQAASVSSNKSARDLLALGTKTNDKHVNLGRAQSTPEHVQLVEVIDRSDAHAMIGFVVDSDALNS